MSSAHVEEEKEEEGTRERREKMKLIQLQRLRQVNALLRAVDRRLFKGKWARRKGGRAALNDMIETRRRNAAAVRGRQDAERAVKRSALHLDLSVPFKLKRKRSSCSVSSVMDEESNERNVTSALQHSPSSLTANCSAELKGRKSTKNDVRQPSWVSAAHFQGADSEGARLIRPRFVSKSSEENPFKALLTSIILNEIRKEPKTYRSLRRSVFKTLKDTLDEDIVQEIVSEVDLFCTVFSAIDLVKLHRNTSLSPKSTSKSTRDIESIALELTRVGATGSVGCYWGADVEERAVEWVWNHCNEWKLPSEVHGYMRSGELSKMLDCCGPDLFASAHKMMWCRTGFGKGETSRLMRLVEEGRLKEVDSIVGPVAASLRSIGQNATAASVEEAPYAFVWNRSIDWSCNLSPPNESRGGASSGSALARYAKKNDADVIELNLEQDRLLASVDHQVRTILHLKQAKLRLRAEEESYVRQICDLLDAPRGDVGNYSTQSNESIRKRKRSIEWKPMRWPKPRLGAYPARQNMIARMRRAATSSPSRSLRTSRTMRMSVADSAVDEHKVIAPSMKIPRMSEFSRVQGNDFCDLTNSVTFEDTLGYFSTLKSSTEKDSSATSLSSAHGANGRSVQKSSVEISTASGSPHSGVLTPSWRRVTAKKTDSEAMDDDTGEEEDTTDEAYLRLHNAYLTDMKEKYRLHRERLKSEREAKRSTPRP